MTSPSNNHSRFLIRDGREQQQRVKEIHHEMSSVDVFSQFTSWPSACGHTPDPHEMEPKGEMALSTNSYVLLFCGLN